MLLWLFLTVIRAVGRVEGFAAIFPKLFNFAYEIVADF